MFVIRARNVNYALPMGLAELSARGIPSPSRYGDVYVLPEPVTTVYSHPTERVLFWPQRDANPFFHCMEMLWLLAGRNDVAFVARFAERMKTFSDDGKTLHGAYGHRWRYHFCRLDNVPFDQIKVLLDLLRAKPLSRRGVLTMWDPTIDLWDEEISHKDVCCNTQIYVWNLAGRLQMTVTCRSNDVAWGLFGSNTVMFSGLMEYLASMLGWEIGTLYILSNNFHIYSNVFDPLRPLAEFAPDPVTGTIKDQYATGQVAPFAMVADPKTFDRDLALFLEDPTSNGFANPFFSRVAKPMYWAHAAWRDRKDPDRFAKAKDIVAQCAATDWRLAATQWLERREAKATA